MNRQPAVTHVIAYVPPNLIKPRQAAPDGIWDLHTLADWDAGHPPANGDQSLEAPRTADPAELQNWASGLLGCPVALEKGSVEIQYGRCPLRRWHEEPLYYVRPARASTSGYPDRREPIP